MEQSRRDLLFADRQVEGSIEAAMKAYTKEPQANDGTHRYGNIRVKPKTSGPYASNTEIEIPITSDNFTITEFENSYLHLICRVTFQVSNLPEISGTDDFSNMLRNNQYVFLGLKCSNHVIHNYHFLFHDIPITSTRQPNALYESFLYSNFKAKGEIANKKWVFSPYDEVSTMDNSTCGMYIPLSELVSGTSRQLDIIIPIKELLAMEGFDEYPNKIFGELKFAFNTTYEGFVYTEVNPIESIRTAVVRGDIDATNSSLHLSDILAIDAETIPYHHAFEQQGISSQVSFITGYDATNGLTYSTVSNFAITMSDIETSDIWMDIRGYEASTAAIKALREHFASNPFTVCAQRVERYSFHSGADASQLSTDVNIRMRRVTDVEILMPTNSLQRTVFHNPALTNFQLLIGSIRYPDQLVSTISPEYFQQQIQNTDFDSFFEANDSYEHSLTDCRTSATGLRNPTTDDTSFVPIFSLERANAGELVFDGRDDTEVKVEITGRPLYPSYNIYPPSTMTVTPPPILCCCTDCYWIFRIVDGIPVCQFVTEYPYEEAYQNPSLQAVRAI